MPEPNTTQRDAASSAHQSGCIPLDGLEMYYETHGTDQASPPLLLLHGGLTTIASSFHAILPTLARTRRVIAVEQQAHGHTADIDRPLSFPQMADDTAALLRTLGVAEVDVFGYSDGGNVALGLAIRHPALVRSLAVAGTNFNNDGLYPEILEILRDPKPDAEEMAELREAYAAVAPRPEDWPILVAKVGQLATEFPGWSPEELGAIAAPVMVIVGDADVVRPEHAVELFRLLSRSQLAVLPGTGHGMGLENPERLPAMLDDFFVAPPDDAKGPSW